MKTSVANNVVNATTWRSHSVAQESCAGMFAFSESVVEHQMMVERTCQTQEHTNMKCTFDAIELRKNAFFIRRSKFSLIVCLQPTHERVNT